MSRWERCGWLALCLLAVLVTFIMQLIGSFIGMCSYCFPEMRKLSQQGLLTDEAINFLLAESMVENMGAIMVWGHGLIIACFAIWFYYGCGRPKLRDAKGVWAPKNFLVILLVAGGMCFFINFAMPVVIPIIPKSIVENYEALMEMAGFGVDTLTIVASIFLAPFGEEFACRGVAFHYAKKMVDDLEDRRKAFWIANSVQALMFGIMHANIIQGSYAFVMGLALGYLRHRYHSLIPAILAHMMINAISSFAWEPIATLLPQSYLVFAICAILCLGIVSVGLFVGGPAEQQTTGETGELAKG